MIFWIFKQIKRKKLNELDEEYRQATLLKPIYTNSINYEALRLSNEIQRVTDDLDENKISIKKCKRRNLGIRC